MGLTLIKGLEPNTAIFTGTKKLETIEYKYIDVDGELYSRRFYSEKNKSVEEIKKEFDFEYEEYPFELLNYVFKIEVPTLRTLYDHWTEPLEYSTNNWINNIITAHKKGFLDKRIKNINSSRNSIYNYRDSIRIWREILRSYSVDIPFTTIGWGNSKSYYYYNISLKDFLEAPSNKIYIPIKELFKKNGLDLDKEITTNKVLKLFKQQISTI